MFFKVTGSKFNKWMEILIGGMLFTFLLFFWVETKQFAGCSLVSVCGIDRLLQGSRPKSERKINIFSFLIMMRLSVIDIYFSTFTLICLQLILLVVKEFERNKCNQEENFMIFMTTNSIFCCQS